VAEPAEHEVRRIRDYVNSQSRQDDQARLVQKSGSYRVGRRVHDVYDVHCARARWWVITEPAHLYDQHDFPEAEQALIFHFGVGSVPGPAESRRGRRGARGTRRRRLASLSPGAVCNGCRWRVGGHFQAVGLKCRDALIALAKDHAADEWVGTLAEPPRAADSRVVLADWLSGAQTQSLAGSLMFGWP
jgi:hypothetical protein